MRQKGNEVKEIAFGLFLRHGWSKVTMSDIAESAGISRPTLYKSFASKEDIFISLAQDHLEKHKSDFSSRAKTIKGVEEKLHELFNVWMIEPYASVPKTENAKDFLENCGQYVPEAINNFYNEFELQLREVLESAQRENSKAKIKDTAHLMILAARALKASAPPLKDLKRMLTGLILMGRHSG